jgi:hypothetical protein
VAVLAQGKNRRGRRGLHVGEEEKEARWLGRTTALACSLSRGKCDKEGESEGYRTGSERTEGMGYRVRGEREEKMGRGEMKTWAARKRKEERGSWARFRD